MPLFYVRITSTRIEDNKLSYLIKVLGALNSAEYPWQISFAVILGMFLGFLPFFNFFSFLVIFLALIININISIFILSSGLFATLGFLLDPVFDKVGFFILTFKPLLPLWTYLYNIPYVQWTGFNNTVVIGSIFVSVVLSPPVFIVLNRLIIKYREKLSWIFKKVPILKGLKLFKIYEKLQGSD